MDDYFDDYFGENGLNLPERNRENHKDEFINNPRFAERFKYKGRVVDSVREDAVFIEPNKPEKPEHKPYYTPSSLPPGGSAKEESPAMDIEPIDYYAMHEKAMRVIMPRRWKSEADKELEELLPPYIEQSDDEMLIPDIGITARIPTGREYRELDYQEPGPHTVAPAPKVGLYWKNRLRAQENLIAIQANELEQLKDEAVVPVNGARSRKEIVQTQAAIALQAMKTNNIEQTKENINIVGDSVSEEWGKQHKSELDKAIKEKAEIIAEIKKLIGE